MIDGWWVLDRWGMVVDGWWVVGGGWWVWVVVGVGGYLLCGRSSSFSRLLNHFSNRSVVIPAVLLAYRSDG